MNAAIAVPAAAIDAAGRAFFISMHADWPGAADAWDDMGGSEPSQERAEIEAAIQSALEAAAPH